MKSMSKTLIIAGTVILFLVCILIGALYYRNLKRGDEEMAITIERNLQAYLNERVSDLNPEFLEKDENGEKIRELSERVSKELSEKLNKEDYKMQSNEILEILKKELQKQIESASENDRERLTELLNMINEYRSDNEERINSNEDRLLSLEILLKGMQNDSVSSKTFFDQLKNDTDGIRRILEQMQKDFADMNLRLEASDQKETDLGKRITGLEERAAGSEKHITVIEQKLTEVLDRMGKLESGANVRIEHWDAETQSLYLAPIE